MSNYCYRLKTRFFLQVGGRYEDTLKTTNPRQGETELIWQVRVGVAFNSSLVKRFPMSYVIT